MRKFIASPQTRLFSRWIRYIMDNQTIDRVNIYEATASYDRSAAQSKDKAGLPD